MLKYFVFLINFLNFKEFFDDVLSFNLRFYPFIKGDFGLVVSG